VRASTRYDLPNVDGVAPAAAAYCARAGHARRLAALLAGIPLELPAESYLCAGVCERARSLLVPVGEHVQYLEQLRNSLDLVDDDEADEGTDWSATLG
jgi:hypothetical protein